MKTHCVSQGSVCPHNTPRRRRKEGSCDPSFQTSVKETQNGTIRVARSHAKSVRTYSASLTGKPTRSDLCPSPSHPESYQGRNRVACGFGVRRLRQVLRNARRTSSSVSRARSD